MHNLFESTYLSYILLFAYLDTTPDFLFPLLSPLHADRSFPAVHMDQIFELFLKPLQMFHSFCAASSSEVVEGMIEKPRPSIISAPRWSSSQSLALVGSGFVGSNTNNTQLSSIQGSWYSLPSWLQPRSPTIWLFLI